MMSIPRSGNIRVTPLADIFEHLRQTKVTGTLVVSNSGMEKSIYFKAGQIVFAASTDVNDRLGEILVKCCRLSRENLDNALQLYKKSVGLKKLGAILVEHGFVTPKDLFSGKHEPLQVIVLKDLYELLEKVIDRCRNVGNVIARIALKHS